MSVGQYIIYSNYKRSLIDDYKAKHTYKSQQVREDYRLLIDQLQYDFRKVENQNILKINQLYERYEREKKHFDIKKVADELNKDVAFGEYQVFLINRDYIVEKASYENDIGYDLGQYKAMKDLLQSVFDKKIDIDISVPILDSTSMTFKRFLHKLSDDGKYLLQIGYVLNIYENLKVKYQHYSREAISMNIYLVNEYILQEINLRDKLFTKKSIADEWKSSKSLLSLLSSHTNDTKLQQIIDTIDRDVKNKSLNISHELSKVFNNKDRLISYLDLKSNTFFIYSITDGLFIKGNEMKLIIKIEYSTNELQKNIRLVFYFLMTLCMVIFVILYFIYLFLYNNVTNKLVGIINDIQEGNKSSIRAIKIKEIDYLNSKYNESVEKTNKEREKNILLLKENKRFIADTVHQIRTPLTNILMNSEMVKKYQNDQKLLKFINQIEASVNMLSNSYEDLAYVTTCDTIEYRPTKISLSKIVTQRVKFFEIISEVNLKRNISNIEDNIYLVINDIECERLIDNNISNAIKYATPNKPIFVELYNNKDTNGVILEFKSFGKPIKNVARIFEKNYREYEAKRGLGLGLNMVKGICKKYNISYSATYIDGQNIFTYTFNSPRES
ncbi:sensor histidine kinase [Desulfamplus magnetovallimortis]|nr:HAMP domain-containing sensor histidine kinase [Desulfamplus magnetovallimortis]